jgi:hypothetical protein
MKAGTVIKWNNFPDRIDGDIKPRWFVYLGCSDSFSKPVLAYICTTTTQKQHYESGGNRSSHDFIYFKKNAFGFEEDCILDLDSYYTKNKEIIDHNKDIEVKGELSGEIMMQIYNKILNSRHYSRIMKLDIHACFNAASIKGLKKP